MTSSAPSAGVAAGELVVDPSVVALLVSRARHQGLQPAADDHRRAEDVREACGCPKLASVTHGEHEPTVRPRAWPFGVHDAERQCRATGPPRSAGDQTGAAQVQSGRAAGVGERATSGTASRPSPALSCTW